MKKRIGLILVFALLLGLVPAFALTSAAEGSAAKADLEIGTYEQMKAFLTSTDDYEGKLVVLTADIDMKSECYDIAKRSFAGTFDGQGHTITNWWANNNVAHGYGLFGYVQEGKTATVKNLVILNSTYRVLKWQVGGIFGNVKGTVNFENVYAALNIGGDWTAAGDIGGFVGKTYGKATVTFRNCVYAGEINSNSANNTSGFVGSNASGDSITIENCAMYGTIKNAQADKINRGGFVAVVNANVTISNSIFAGTVADTSQKQYAFVATGTGALTMQNNIYLLAEGFTDVTRAGATKVDALTQDVLDAHGLIGWTIKDGKPVPSNATAIIGYQIAHTEGENTFDLRLVAKVRVQDAALENVKNVGFAGTLTLGETTKMFERSVGTVYSGILQTDASGNTTQISASTYFEEGESGYLFTLVIRNIPANSGDLVIHATPFYENTATVRNASVTFTVNTNQLS